MSKYVVFPRALSGDGMAASTRMAFRSGFLLAALGGVALGSLSLLLNGVLPGGSSRLVNSDAVWVVGAFAAGAVLRDGGWRTWLAGMAVLVGAVAGFYGSLVVFEHRTVSPTVVIGPAEGAGRLGRGTTVRHRGSVVA